MSEGAISSNINMLPIGNNKHIIQNYRQIPQIIMTNNKTQGDLDIPRNKIP